MFQFAEDKIRGAGGALSRAEFMEQVGRAKIRMERTGPADIELLPEAIQAAKVWQEKLYGPAGRAAQELRVFSIKQDRRRVALEEKMQKLLDDTNNPLGMTVKQLRFLESLQEQIAALKAEADVANTFKLDPNYMNRLYNKTKIEADRDQFINILVREGGYTPQEAAARTDSILTGKAFEVIEEDATGMARSLKERQIDVDSIFLEDYLELNIASVGRYYATRMGADIELARAFGSIDMKEVTQRIVAEYDAVIQNIKHTSTGVGMKQKIFRFLLNSCGILYLFLEKYIEYPDDDVILGLEIDTNLQKMSRNQLCKYMDEVSGSSGFYDLSSTTKIRYGCQLLKDFYNRFNLVETK